MTRITHRSIQESTLANLQRNLSAMAVTQEQLSTQKRINRPSDDPTGTVSVLSLRSDLRATEQHRRNADDGVAWLGTTFVQAHTDAIKGAAGDLLTGYPWLLAVVLFFAAALLYSQAATTRALMPTALALGVAPAAAVAAIWYGLGGA